MADNVTITEGSGTSVATDDVGGQHYQRIKLTDGAADSSTPVNVDIGAKANALRVVPANDITDGTYIGDIKFGEALPAGDNNIGNVDIASSVALDVSAATVTVDGTVTANLGATDNAVLDAIQAAVETIDNAISGSEMQVDVVAALPAGNNNIGKVDIASSVALDVSAATVTVDLGENNDVTMATLPDTASGDLAAINSNTDFGSVVGGGTEATALRVTLANDSTGVLSVDDGGGSLTVDGTVTANLSATDNAVLDAIQAAVETIDNAISGNEMQVDVVASLPAGDNNIGNVDIASSVALDVSAATVTVDLGENNDVVASGDVAHDSADSGNPIKVGGKAVNMDGTAPGTAVAENDRANFICDTYGRQCVETVHPNFGSAAANYGSAQTNTEVIAAPGAGLSLYITDIILSTDTAGSIKLVEDTASAVDKVEVMYFAANGGCVMPLRTPIKLTANKNFGITSTISGNHSITVSYYIAP